MSSRKFDKEPLTEIMTYIERSILMTVTVQFGDRRWLCDRKSLQIMVF
jgi:uncharacterized protein YaeQ